MTESYREALAAESMAWQELDSVLHTQRQAIIHRASEQVWESQQRLRELLTQVLVTGQETMRLQTADLDEPTAALEQETQALRRQVRDGVRLNNALLRDICSYLEMVRPLPFPYALDAAPRSPRVIGSIEHAAEKSRVA